MVDRQPQARQVTLDRPAARFGHVEEEERARLGCPLLELKFTARCLFARTHRSEASTLVIAVHCGRYGRLIDKLSVAFPRQSDLPASNLRQCDFQSGV